MKIKNIAQINIPYYDGQLTEIICDHEFFNSDKEWYHEQFFIDEKGEITAYFKQNANDDYSGRAEQLSIYRKDIFIIQGKKANKDNISIVQVDNDKYRVLNTYDYIEQGEEEKTFIVKKNKLYGFIDIDGVEFIEPQYFKANSFYNGFAIVAKEYNKWGLINKENEVIIPFLYQEPEQFHVDKMGNVVLKKEEKENLKKGILKSYIFNTKGEIVFECTNNIENLDYGNFLIEKEDKTYEIMRLNKNG